VIERRDSPDPPAENAPYAGPSTVDRHIALSNAGRELCALRPSRPRVRRRGFRRGRVFCKERHVPDSS
jgi:hypothetical protein